ncbi:MAG TPA: FAD-dependent oxidoreductase, partial [Steroidobacteraceae bacterium]
MNRRHFFQSTLAAAVAYALPVPRLYALDQAASQAAGGLAAVKLDGTATVIEQAALADLKASLRGPLLLAGDAGYDAARHVLNESIDMHPALVVQPTGVADVMSAVRFARDRDLLLAVKCGGHSPSGKSTCEKGMQIDLSRFRGVRVDAKARRAYVEGGSLLGEVDHEAMAQGLVTTCGTVSHTGVGGLTLGGGFGRL